MSSKKNYPPRVCLLGRRNVGKSTLFNALYKKRYAITDASPGLTRDILEVELEHKGFVFRLYDMPGLDLELRSPDGLRRELEQKILQLSMKHLRRMDLIIVLMEAPLPNSYDIELLRFMRRHMSAFASLYVLNKVDKSQESLEVLLAFYEAGFPECLPLSARGRWNLDKLLDLIMQSLSSRKKLPDQNAAKATALQGKELRLAIAGRPNAGKSSLFNRILGEERALVSEAPGTTRDSIDSFFQYKDQQFRIIDTAGLRRSSLLPSSKDPIGFYSLRRAQKAISQAQVVIHLIDSSLGLTDWDKKICAMIKERRASLIFALSKWDLMRAGPESQKIRKDIEDRMRFLFPYMARAPFVFCSAHSGHGVRAILDHALRLYEAMYMEIPTAELNAQLQKWQESMASKNKGLKVFYAVQSGCAPIRFRFFINDKRYFSASMRAYFENSIRSHYKLEGLSLHIDLRHRESKAKGKDAPKILAKTKLKNKKSR